jgi:alkylation response protein AidB-like acyl-CoA dehydrogenase
MTAETVDLEEFRATVRSWCDDHVPKDWRTTQLDVPEDEYVRFQKWWFEELRQAGFAVPHWPKEWGGGMSLGEQMVLFQELATHDAPRLVLSFVSIHHAASTLLEAGTDEQRQRHLPAILDGEIWVQGFSEPEAGSDLASLKTTARRDGDSYVVNGQKLWASGAQHADWCLLLARTDPAAPKRKGISYFLMDMRTPGIDIRPIKQATGDAHFAEMFLDDVVIPASQLVGAENAGWQVAQSTRGAERGMTMLELVERLWIAGFRWLVETSKPVADDPLVIDRLVQIETDITALRGLCRNVVRGHDAGTIGPADASIVKLFYSELLQRMMGFASEVAGLPTHLALHKPMSSGWESGAWVLDFICSWEWTIPAGTSEIQRNIIGERGLGLPREPSVE